MLYICTVAMKQQLNFFLMTYKFTISDKGSNSRQSNSYDLSLDYAKHLAIESGNPITIKCNKGHFSETFVW